MTEEERLLDASSLLNSDNVPVDIQDIIEETAAIQGQMVSQLTKDLAAQRAISRAWQKRVKELTQMVNSQQEMINKLDKELHPEQKPVENLEQAEAVLDRIIEEGVASSNGDKPAAKEVASPRRPASPPVKESAAK